jgi:hypothetical protein
MSQNSARPLSKFNLVLALLWLVDVAVTVAGYLVLTSSNATQADFYTSQSADYVAYFAAQSGSNLGATLIGAGIVGFMVTLAAMVVARAFATRVAAPATAGTHDEPGFDFDDDADFDTHEKTAVREHPAAETGSITTVTAATGAPAPTAVAAEETAATAVPASDQGDEPTGDAKTAR